MSLILCPWAVHKWPFTRLSNARTAHTLVIEQLAMRHGRAAVYY